MLPAAAASSGGGPLKSALLLTATALTAAAAAGTLAYWWLASVAAPPLRRRGSLAGSAQAGPSTASPSDTASAQKPNGQQNGWRAAAPKSAPHGKSSLQHAGRIVDVAHSGASSGSLESPFKRQSVAATAAAAAKLLGAGASGGGSAAGAWQQQPPPSGFSRELQASSSVQNLGGGNWASQRSQASDNWYYSQRSQRSNVSDNYHSHRSIPRSSLRSNSSAPDLLSGRCGFWSWAAGIVRTVQWTPSFRCGSIAPSVQRLIGQRLIVPKPRTARFWHAVAGASARIAARLLAIPHSSSSAMGWV